MRKIRKNTNTSPPRKLLFSSPPLLGKERGLGGEVRTKKSLGQNFLRDEGILKKIVDFAQIENTDLVIEVGPGEGTLTKLILEKAKRVIAIEKDEKLVEKLKEKFNKEIKDNRLKIIEGDILNTDYIIPQVSKVPFDTYKLVGNIPYYITGALFKKFLENPPADKQPQSITFVVQKEVAERIMARDGKENILSISIKAYGTPEYGGIIKAGSFSPSPKVDSAILAVRGISKERFGRITPLIPLTLKGEKFEKRFFEIVKLGFAHKRKLLISNLVSRRVLDSFRKYGINEKARAEDLKVEDWVCITRELI